LKAAFEVAAQPVAAPPLIVETVEPAP